MNTVVVDKIIQYALLVAGEEDDSFDRQLGPIHFIKYVYLVDLDYAAVNSGETFTKVKWQFYKFGPWSQEVNNRIEPALSYIHADKKIFPSNYGDKDEWVRWTAHDNSYKKILETDLPFTVKSSLRRDVHRFGQATAELLSYVYSTKPMLSAAPGEYLDFSKAIILPKELSSEQNEKEPLSVRKQKIIKANLQNLRMRNAERLASKRKKVFVKPPRSPRYDEVFNKGLEWIDSLAGDKLPEGNNDVVFCNSIWKSPSRSGDDFSE